MTDIFHKGACFQRKLWSTELILALLLTKYIFLIINHSNTVLHRGKKNIKLLIWICDKVRALLSITESLKYLCLWDQEETKNDYQQFYVHFSCNSSTLLSAVLRSNDWACVYFTISISFFTIYHIYIYINHIKHLYIRFYIYIHTYIYNCIIVHVLVSSESDKGPPDSNSHFQTTSI